MRKILPIVFLFLGALVFAQTQALEIDESGQIFVLVEGERINLQEYLTPVGVINSFVGDDNLVPEGWLICDGRTINKSTNPRYAKLVDLLRAIAGTNSSHPYVDGVSDDEANLPDFRGRFARGADSTQNAGFAGRDPEYDSRLNESGEIVPNMVGTIQDDAFQGHKVQTSISVSTASGPNQNRLVASTAATATYHFTSSVLISDEIHGTPRISSETRPQNVNVNFIIKY
jgi:microcystin-dependent protein